MSYGGSYYLHNFSVGLKLFKIIFGKKKDIRHSLEGFPLVRFGKAIKIKMV